VRLERREEPILKSSSGSMPRFGTVLLLDIVYLSMEDNATLVDDKRER
jgi:hypothetical protein